MKTVALVETRADSAAVAVVAALPAASAALAAPMPRAEMEDMAVMGRALSGGAAETAVPVARAGSAWAQTAVAEAEAAKAA
jgi:hypothetical protein